MVESRAEELAQDNWGNGPVEMLFASLTAKDLGIAVDGMDWLDLVSLNPGRSNSLREDKMVENIISRISNNQKDLILNLTYLKKRIKKNKSKAGAQVGNTILIDKMLPEDWELVREIYQEGIATGNATFQKEAPSWEEWNSNHILECRIVARSGGKILGWAALSPVSNRSVYAGVAEVSIYVSQIGRGKSIGSKLLKSLIETSEQNGFWTLQSVVFPENTSSLKLHNKYGFREAGRREHIGKMNGIWRDVILLEKRSKKVGID